MTRHYLFLQVTMSSEDTSRSRAVHYSFDRTLQIAIHAVLTSSAHHKLLTHMYITHQPDADKRRDTCFSRATHTIHESNLTFVKAWGWSRASRHVFASRQELLTGIVKYPSHVLLMTNDNKRTRNVYFALFNAWQSQYTAIHEQLILLFTCKHCS